MEELAAEKNCTPGQLALAWVLARGDDIVPIPGTTTVEHLEENVAALEVELTAADLADLEAVFPKAPQRASATATCPPSTAEAGEPPGWEEAASGAPATSSTAQ